MIHFRIHYQFHNQAIYKYNWSNVWTDKVSHVNCQVLAGQVDWTAVNNSGQVLQWTPTPITCLSRPDLTIAKIGSEIPCHAGMCHAPVFPTPWSQTSSNELDTIPIFRASSHQFIRTNNRPHPNLGPLLWLNLAAFLRHENTPIPRTFDV